MSIATNYCSESLVPIYTKVPDSIPLNEVITGSDEKTARTAEEVFGESYNQLFKKLWEADHNQFSAIMLSVSNFFLLQPGLLAAGFLGLPYLVAQPYVNLISILGGVGEGVVVSVFLLFKSRVFKGQKEVFSKMQDMCLKIFEFNNLFEEFRKKPQAEDVKALFTGFHNLIEIARHVNKCDEYDKNSKTFCLIDFIAKEETFLFRETGELFLMDAITELLEGGPLALEWQNTLVTTKDSGYSEPWNRLKISNPNIHAYDEFFRLKDSFKSVEMVDKMVEACKEAIERAIAEQK